MRHIELKTEGQHIFNRKRIEKEKWIVFHTFTLSESHVQYRLMGEKFNWGVKNIDDVKEGSKQCKGDVRCFEFAVLLKV